MILSVDPGDSVGLALWEPDGKLVWKMKVSLEDFIDWCEALDSQVSTIVYEDFTLRRNRANAQTGSKMGAPQVIGIVKMLAKRHSAKLVRQQPDILRIAAMHAGVKVPKGHIPDDVSAYLHGYYYFEKEGIL